MADSTNSPGASYRIVAAGDAMLLLEFESVIRPDVNARAIAVGEVLASSAIPGVRDVVPAYCSVAVHFDPWRTDVGQLIVRVRDIAGRVALRPETMAPCKEVPVCYGGAFGPDLAEVALWAGTTGQEVAHRHSAHEYRVYMLGFLPGFAYMGTVDASIAQPRRAVPRTTVPAGSVGIAGQETGVYPLESPGGWRLIGRTPMRPFDARREEPFLFAPGDRVRFVAIDAATFARLNQWE